jgi:peptide/nickel transport system substrate-binding protein
VPIDTVLPPGFGDHIPRPTTTRETLEDKDARIAAAVDVLEREGWKRNPEGIWSKTVDGSNVTLSVDIATANLPFLAATANYLKTQWTALGVNVSVRQFEQVDLTQTVIRTRDYEALLFGTTVGRTLDFYPYWHSSQRNDPGLNIALYANITADAALEKSRTTTNPEERTQALVDFLTEFERDTPALFLFVPTITQIIPEQLIMNPITKLTSPHERFVHVESWYIKTESVWPFFAN